jgi:outer membrane protein TolC
VAPAEPTPAGFTLNEAFQAALAANPDLQAARERTRIAEAVLARARADYYPTLVWNENYLASNNPLNRFSYLLQQGATDPFLLFSPPSVVDNLQTDLHFQQDLYSGGLRAARSGAAGAEAEATRFALAAVRNQTLYQVAEGYYRLFQAGELIAVRRQAVAQVESELAAVRARVRAQTAVESDALQVEVRLAQVREALVTALNQQELTWAILENVVGARLGHRPLPETLPPAPWSDRIDAVESAVAQAIRSADDEAEAAVNEALGKRPEVGQVESQRKAAEERVRAARAGKLPSVGLVSDYNFFTGSTGLGRQSFFVGLVGSLNLCDGGRTKANVEQAKAQLREILARDRRVRLDVELDVRRAYLQLKDARERLRVAASAVANAEAALRQIESRYANQTATVTQLIEAQVGLTDARVRVTNARAEIEVARAALQRAVGRFTDLLAPGPTTH